MRAADLCALGRDTSPFAFEPNALRGRKVATLVRAELADSLEAVLLALGDAIGLAGKDLIARVRAGLISPVVFGAYTELVEAVFSDNIDMASQIAAELCAPNFGCVDKLRIVTLDDVHLGVGQTARYRRLVDDDQRIGKDLRRLTEDEFAGTSKRVSDAVDLLEAGAPALAGELRTLVHEIVLVDRPGERPFGASSFQLWGALFLKPRRQASRVEIAEQLAHECAHALLFGFGMGRPLVENDPEELYPSPLRSDPRPMEGVVHATFVIARMHYTVTRLLQSGLLTKEETEEARDLISRNARGYADGFAVVERDARWTEAGGAALQSAQLYMSAQTAH